VVVVYRMPHQALNTLYTLSAQHQHGADPASYEVVVVENISERCLDPRAVAALGENFHYRLRDERGVSPAPALNEGIALARGALVGLMIDGARMVTPGLVAQVLAAFRAYPQCLVAAPGYDLGEDQQQNSGVAGYDETVEADLLAGIDWKVDGYRLFEICCFSPANRKGYLTPLMECGCLFAPRVALDRIEGVDERFSSRGGGMVNLDLFRRLAMQPGLRLVVLPGEGSFHQFHGGVTSGGMAERDDVVRAFQDEYQTLRGVPYKSPRREPTLLGPVPMPALPFLQRSAELAHPRARRLTGGGLPLWEEP
jgi:hypothetical protein